ncbi:MAG: amidohydrolase family protein [Euzebyales bacterium]|nr:amidohydrolase family protein [Euzebyales bacterium]
MRERMDVHGLMGRADGRPYRVEWTTLCEYLQWLERRGVSTNIASFVGAGTLRVHEVGYEDRPATTDELRRMCGLLDDEMAHGALGVASALIYPPETAYSTEELVALARVASGHGGLYASHIRSEGTMLLEAVQELVDIARLSDVRAEIYHLKAAGRHNWPKLESAIEIIEEARGRGLAVTADMYPYDYCGTSVSACFPPWAHDGGVDALHHRLRDPETRTRIREDMHGTHWENLFRDAGPDNIIVSGALSTELATYLYASLTDIGARMGVTAEEAAMDLVLGNDGDVFAIYFDMSLDNVRRQITLPWISLCSDAESLAAEGKALESGVHPRAYGAFARVLGQFVRDEQLLPLEEAVRKMTSLPADNLSLGGRGRLQRDYHADVVIFDPTTVADHAMPTDPHKYATGMVHVFVNGTHVLDDGVHTGATAGRFVVGPGAA